MTNSKILKLIASIVAVSIVFCGNIIVNAKSSTELNLTTKYYSGSSWVNFSKSAEANSINGIRLTTAENSKYYLKYRTQNEGRNQFYSYVSSKSSADNSYAGTGHLESTQHAIQLLEIDVYDSSSDAKITSGIVVMYRVKTSDKWLPWVSNADAEYMQSVKYRYNISGSLDTESSYTGIVGKNIKAIEIRIFEENEILSDCGFKNASYLNVPFISQVKDYPSGCESVSTVMALQKMGVNISVDKFIDNYLDKDPNIYGFNPNECFGGDPRTTSGMGCYAPTIMKALNKALADKTQYALNATGSSLAELCSKYIDISIPVVIWATQNMKEAYTVNYKEGLVWITPEHCLTLVGYDDTCYIFNDPQKGAAVHYLKNDVELAYKALGKQAVVILNKLIPSVPQSPTVESRTLNSITLTPVSGYEYKINDGAWQTSNVFSGLSENTSYNFYQRTAETDTHYASVASSPLNAKTDKGPAPSELSSSKFTVKDNNISKITTGTTVSTLLSGLNGGSHCKVYKGDTVQADNAVIGTGMTVKIMDDDTVKASYQTIVTGDTNGDGQISVTDMVSVKSHVLGKSTLSGVYAVAADTNGDLNVTITDFIQIKSHILGAGN